MLQNPNFVIKECPNLLNINLTDCNLILKKYHYSLYIGSHFQLSGAFITPTKNKFSLTKLSIFFFLYPNSLNITSVE